MTFIEKFIVTTSLPMEVEITIKEKVQQFLPLLLFSKHSDDHLRCFKVILKYAANVDIMDKQQRTPLLEMINQQNIEGVRLLIEKGCNINRIKCIKKRYQ